MNEVDYGRSGAMNPADFLSKPFTHVCKPPSLLERLTKKQTPSDVPSASVHDTDYKFDFLFDAADVDIGSLPIIGRSAPTPPSTNDPLASATKSPDTVGQNVDETNIDLVLGQLPRVPSFRANKRDAVRQSDASPNKLSRLQDENAYLRQMLQNQHLTERLCVVTGISSPDVPPAASHVQFCSDPASSSQSRPPSDTADTSQHPGTDTTATSTSGLVSPDKPALDETPNPTSQLEALVDRSSTTTTEDGDLR